MRKGVVMEVGKRHAVVLTDTGAFVHVRMRGEAFEVGEEIMLPNAARALPRHHRMLRFASIGAAMLLVLFTAILLQRMTAPAPNIVAYVSIDINPSVELGLNSAGLVVKVNEKNERAADLVEGLRLVGMPVEEAVQLIMVAAEEKVLANRPKADIVITSVIVDETVPLKEEELQQKIQTQVSKVIETHHPEQTEQYRITVWSAPKEVLQEAEEAGLSAGKMTFYLKAKSSGAEVTPEELRTHSIRDIAEQFEDKHLLGPDPEFTKEMIYELLSRYTQEKEQSSQGKQIKAQEQQKEEGQTEQAQQVALKQGQKPEQQQNQKAEEKQRKEEQKAQEKLLERERKAQEKQLEKERKAREKQLEKERKAQEKKLEQERKAQEKRQEQERNIPEKKQEQWRKGQEKKEEQLRKAQEKQQEQFQKIQEKWKEQQQRAQEQLRKQRENMRELEKKKQEREEKKRELTEKKREKEEEQKQQALERQRQAQEREQERLRRQEEKKREQEERRQPRGKEDGDRDRGRDDDDDRNKSQRDRSTEREEQKERDEKKREPHEQNRALERLKEERTEKEKEAKRKAEKDNKNDKRDERRGKDDD